MMKPNFYKATDSKGRTHRVMTSRKYLCALIIDPIPLGLFKHPQAEFYVSRAQALRHAEDWRRLDYPIEVAEAVPITEREYDAITPPGMEICRAQGNTPESSLYTP